MQDQKAVLRKLLGWHLDELEGERPNEEKASYVLDILLQDIPGTEPEDIVEMEDYNFSMAHGKSFKIVKDNLKQMKIPFNIVNEFGKEHISTDHMLRAAIISTMIKIVRGPGASLPEIKIVDDQEG